MGGEHEKLRETLEQLRSQMDELRQVDPQVAASLDSTIAEAETALGEDATKREHHESIIERLRDEVLEYEASHPNLAANLGSVLKTLAQMGI